MKKVILLILLFFTSGITCAQTIENLKTFKEVGTFLEKEISKEYTFESFFEGENEIDTEDFNEVVQKVDLDNDGFTDLCIDYVGILIFIRNKGNNTYEEIKLLEDEDQPLRSISMGKINDKIIFIRTSKVSAFDVTNHENIITQKNQKDVVYDRKTNKMVEVIRDIQYRVDTLEVKYGTFLKYNKSKEKFKNEIEEIHFEATPCFGSCPVFELKITSDGNLEYHGKRSTNFKGRKKLKISSEEVEALFGLIEYTDVKSLKDSYSINVTDNPAANLKVTFKNGDVKEIYDYGRFGTYNLRVIYKKLLEISANIK
ncbi:DUF6438 domain-containing protein [Kordia sp.]|uniref:DUF6438 domain-containing protein n=1 Tax=Kordia sp. TaxID=1965332 RepID=UPI003D2CD10A